MLSISTNVRKLRKKLFARNSGKCKKKKNPKDKKEKPDSSSLTSMILQKM